MLNTELDYPLISSTNIITSCWGADNVFTSAYRFKNIVGLFGAQSQTNIKIHFYIIYKESLLNIQNSISRTSNLNSPYKGLIEQSKT